MLFTNKKCHLECFYMYINLFFHIVLFLGVNTKIIIFAKYSVSKSYACFSILSLGAKHDLAWIFRLMGQTRTKKFLITFLLEIFNVNLSAMLSKLGHYHGFVSSITFKGNFNRVIIFFNKTPALYNFMVKRR